ncbi:MAG: hypothetical protein Q4F97_03455 [Bacteroidales bacterium]|nr:hypothetical protein [Bacteroidales bacterium]
MEAKDNSEKCSFNLNIDLSKADIGEVYKAISEDATLENNAWMNLEIVSDILFSEKDFDKVEKLIETLRSCDSEIYKGLIFHLLPEMICYHLFNDNQEMAFKKIDELAKYCNEDFLLFTHLLDVLDAYGFTYRMRETAKDVLKENTGLDEDDKAIIESLISINDYPTDNETLIKARNIFFESSRQMNIPEIASHNIIDALIVYFENNFQNDKSHIIHFELDSFRDYIAVLIDNENMDTFEYGASILWGSVYFIDSLYSKGMISDEEYNYFLDIIEHVKAFFIVNIPWNGFWKIKFLYSWTKPSGIDDDEFVNESEIVEYNLKTKASQIVNKSITNVLGPKIKSLSYGRYLEEEEIAFKKNIEKEDIMTFGFENKKDSMFPYLNYLSGETDNEFKPEPAK